MKRSLRAPSDNCRQTEQGFIPLMICVFLVVVGLAYLVYLRVAQAQH